MSDTNAETYALVQRLLQLQDDANAFRFRVVELRREAVLTERRYLEEEHRIRNEYAVTLKQLRTKLDIPEPPPSDPNKPSSLDDLFPKFIDIFGNPKISPSEP